MQISRLSMRTALMVFLAGIMMTPALAPAAQAGMKLKDLPPVVVQTWPRAGDADVEAGVAQIKVTFSKPMMTKKMWSWVMVNKDTFPQLTGQPHYLADGRTCVLPVELMPGRVYAIWINQGKYNNFKGIYGQSAVPYLLVFETSQ